MGTSLPTPRCQSARGTSKETIVTIVNDVNALHLPNSHLISGPIAYSVTPICAKSPNMSTTYKEGFVDDLLRTRVLCKVAAGGIDDGEVDETH